MPQNSPLLQHTATLTMDRARRVLLALVLGALVLCSWLAPMDAPAMQQLGPNMPEAGDNAGLLDKIKGWVAKNADVKKNFEDLKLAAEQATEHIIKLIVVFLLQTLVIPLLLLWAMYGLARRMFEWPGPPPQTGRPVADT